MAVRIPDLIRKKRDGQELGAEEMEFFVRAVVGKSIDEAQIGAMLMAMYLRKLSFRETVWLTRAMSQTGEVLRFEGLGKEVLADKHSTGGVGDKVSLVLAPALAACGVKVPMVSGRALGFTGGTLDKLESIPGFQSQLDLGQMRECLRRAGCFICGATGSLAPADAVLYKFRDVTSTVEDRKLMAASILSKKASEGIGALVVDVKVGAGSPLKSEAEGAEMAELLRAVGKELGLRVEVVLSEMEWPLGRFVGNALEVVEAVMCLRNESRGSVRELAKVLGGVLLRSKGAVATVEEGERRIEGVLERSEALERFRGMLLAQGVAEEAAGELCAGRWWRVLGRAREVTRLRSRRRGVVEGIDAGAIGKACWRLGAGREKAESGIEHSVGVVVVRGIGEEVEEGECWIEVHHSTEKLEADVEELIQGSLRVNENRGKFTRKLRTLIL